MGKSRIRRREQEEAQLPDAVARRLPAEEQGLWVDGALMEEKVGGGFMDKGQLTTVVGLMTGGHCAHAADGCGGPQSGPREWEAGQAPT